MRIRLILCMFLVLSLLAAGCAPAPAEAPSSGETVPPATPAPTPVPATAGEAEPAATATEAPDALPAVAQADSASRAFPFAAIDGQTAYWCTGYGIFSIPAQGQGSLFSETLGRNPAIMDGKLYLIEDQMDITEEMPYPVNSADVTASRILAIPLTGGEATEIYSAPYIQDLQARDGRLYFSTTQGEALREAGCLFSIAADGGDEILLAEECLSLYGLDETHAYYSGVGEDTPTISRVPLGGGESQVLLSDAGAARTPVIFQGTVYYVTYDLMNPEAENAFGIMSLQEAAPARLGDAAAQALLGVWSGGLYYLTQPGDGEAAPAIGRLDLNTLASETVQDAVTEVAALGSGYCLYSRQAPLLLAGEVHLTPLSGGDAATPFAVTDAVESQG